MLRSISSGQSHQSENEKQDLALHQIKAAGQANTV